MIAIEHYFGGWSQRMNGQSLVASSGNQMANGENKYQPSIGRPIYSTQNNSHGTLMVNIKYIKLGLSIFGIPFNLICRIFLKR